MNGADVHGAPDGPRYVRQRRLPELGDEGQRRLAASRVLAIGAGGLGAPVLAYLAAAGVGRMTVVDPDRVDLTNLHRQVLFTAADVGRPKAEVAAERLSAQNPEVEVTALVDAVTPATALTLLSGHDLVLDGSDNFPTRYLASDACEILRLPLVWGSILGFAGQVAVFRADTGGPTYRDLHPVPPRPGEVPSCAEAGVLGMLCGVIGSTMAMEAVKVLLGIGAPLEGRLALHDALRGRWDELPLARDPRRAPVTTLEDVAVTCSLPPPMKAAPRPAPPPPGRGRSPPPSSPICSPRGCGSSTCARTRSSPSCACPAPSICPSSACSTGRRRAPSTARCSCARRDGAPRARSGSSPSAACTCAP